MYTFAQLQHTTMKKQNGEIISDDIEYDISYIYNILNLSYYNSKNVFKIFFKSFYLQKLNLNVFVSL